MSRTDALASAAPLRGSIKAPAPRFRGITHRRGAKSLRGGIKRFSGLGRRCSRALPASYSALSSLPSVLGAGVFVVFMVRRVTIFLNPLASAAALFQRPQKTVQVEFEVIGYVHVRVPFELILSVLAVRKLEANPVPPVHASTDDPRRLAASRRSARFALREPGVFLAFGFTELEERAPRWDRDRAQSPAALDKLRCRVARSRR